MADLSLDSPTSFRLVAAAAATVASLALVALGVQIGTDGLGADDPGRNRAATASSRSAAVVDDRSRPRPEVGLDQTLLSLVPVAPPAASAPTASTSTAAGGSGGAPAPSPAPAEPAPPAPGPSPAPAPVPVPAPEVPPAPAVPSVPDAEPLLGPLEPVLEPLVEGVVDPLATLGAPAPEATPSASSNAGLLSTLAGLLGL